MPKPAKCIHPADMKFELDAAHLLELSEKWLQTRRAREYKAMRLCCFLYSMFLASGKEVARLKPDGEAVS